MREVRRSLVDDAIAEPVPPGHRLPFEPDAAEGGGPPQHTRRRWSARCRRASARRGARLRRRDLPGRRPMLDALRAGVPVDAAAIRAEVAAEDGGEQRRRERLSAGRLQLAGRFGRLQVSSRRSRPRSPPSPPRSAAASSARARSRRRRRRRGGEGSPAARTLEPWPQRRRRGGPMVTEDGAVIGWSVPPADRPHPTAAATRRLQARRPAHARRRQAPAEGDGAERVLEARIAAAADSLAVARRRPTAPPTWRSSRASPGGSGAAEMYLEGGRSVESAVRAAIGPPRAWSRE